ncbi:MAG: formate--phosphoribosylaminoimidazolecarboxamide ligase [Candidatus Eremiobacteraeota bacterium]|nr:formate--phosphoribosylaminoimidazolecarboxamide ligase [Candidatus Eremiobacteraeota bacterium]
MSHKSGGHLPQLYTVATLGSHSALQILKGAKDEGFHTLAVVTPMNERLYSSFAFVDETIVIPRYSDFPKLEREFKKRKIILVPHGSFVAYLSMDEHKVMTTPYFGNKAVLDWEADRMRQREWLLRAGLKMPRQFTRASEIDRPVIVKLYGAQGGKGYLFVKNAEDFTARASHLVEQCYIMQEYVLGVPVYIHYFYSPLTGKLEIMSMDRRYESNVDSLGRIPLADQEGWDIQPSYVVIGNQPISLRESLLAEAFTMGESVVRVSREICPERGLFGAFCLETIVTPESEFVMMEISARIVAGTNLFIDGSPYSYLNYDEPMSTGRRIARELKNALLSNSLELVLDQSSRLTYDEDAQLNGDPVVIPGPGVPAN